MAESGRQVVLVGLPHLHHGLVGEEAANVGARSVEGVAVGLEGGVQHEVGVDGDAAVLQPQPRVLLLQGPEAHRGVVRSTVVVVVA